MKMSDEITSRALAVLQACSSDDEDDAVRGSIAAGHNEGPENEDYVSSAREILNASPSTPLFSRRDAGLTADLPSSADVKMICSSKAPVFNDAVANIPQDGMVDTNPDSKPFESAADAISTACKYIEQSSNANGTPSSNDQSCNETFWICKHCSYTVNSISRDNCFWCSANRTGEVPSNYSEQIQIAPSKSSFHELNIDNGADGEEDDGHSSDSDSEYDEGAVKSWLCEKCSHLNTQTKYKCCGCKSWRSRKRFVGKNARKRSKKKKISMEDDKEDELEQDWDDKSISAQIPFLCYGKNKDTLVTRAKPNDQITSDESWACIRCGSDNDVARKRCSECRGWRDGKIVPSPNKTLALPKGVEGDDDVKEWTCIKCSQPNTKSKSKCFNCGGWKDGKRRVKIDYSPSKSEANKQPLQNAALLKKELKPQFEVGDQVYAPWFSQRKSEQAWYPAVITNKTVNKYGEYGEIRSYDVRFDEDGSYLCDVEDYCVFFREDYLLHAEDNGRTEWIGVKNVLDKSSRDKWAKQVGWYEATIDGDKYSFARLFDALRAYDNSVLAKRGKNVKPSELNLPNGTGRETRSRYTSTKSHLPEAKYNNHSATHNYTCVSFDKRAGKYEAYVQVEKKRSLGRYLLAADAALAHDQCARRLGISSAMNFPSLIEYSNVRKKESKERNINVPRSEIQSYLRSKVNNVVSAVATSNELIDDNSGGIFEVEEEDTVDSDLAKANSSPNPLQPRALSSPRSGKSYADMYTGVYFDKGTGKYSAQVGYAGKTHNFGICDLAADAAMLYDKCIVVLKGSDRAPVNFTSDAEYVGSRVQESSDRRIEALRLVDVLGFIKEKVDKLSSNVANNDVGRPASHSPSAQPSLANQKEEPYPVASYSNTSSNTARPNNAPKMIMLTSDQTESLRFPTGCSVWLSNGNHSGTYNEGKVTSVHLDLASRDLLYEVAPKQQATPILVQENNLAFAPQCPVFISEDSYDNTSSDESNRLLTGRVLLCKRVDVTWIYTVAIQNEAGLEMRENILSSQVTYWKEDSA